MYFFVPCLSLRDSENEELLFFNYILNKTLEMTEYSVPVIQIVQMTITCM